jgi:hypothetical protein
LNHFIIFYDAHDALFVKKASNDEQQSSMISLSQSTQTQLQTIQTSLAQNLQQVRESYQTAVTVGDAASKLVMICVGSLFVLVVLLDLMKFLRLIKQRSRRKVHQMK